MFEIKSSLDIYSIVDRKESVNFKGRLILNVIQSEEQREKDGN